MQCSRVLALPEQLAMNVLRTTASNLVCSLEQESQTPFMLSIHSPANVVMVLVSIFISKTHTHFAFSAST